MDPRTMKLITIDKTLHQNWWNRCHASRKEEREGLTCIEDCVELENYINKGKARLMTEIYTSNNNIG